MNRSLTVLLCAILILTTASAAWADTCSDQARAEADQLYEQAMSTYLVDRTMADMKRAIPQLERATKLCPNHDQAWALLCELYWQYGDALPRKTSEQKKVRIGWFEKGIAAGERGYAVNPQNVQAFFFKATNESAAADMHGWSSSMWMLPKMREYMEQVEKMEPNYLYGGKDRFWCEVLVRVPLWLSNRMGYPPEEVAAKIDGQIAREPRYLVNYNYAGRVFYKLDQHDRALNYLTKAIEDDPDALPSQAGVNRMAQRNARVTWLNLTGKPYPQR
ncbi:MAG: hypothetical protein P9M14_10310 [Candidatus Alcyoniella australis]|nr:hypothetical protein [Candidatus Alcyoniella australis]